MYKNILQTIDNVAIWPVISFLIFFIFFIVLLWWTFTVDRTFIQKMKDLPMDGPLTQSTKQTNETEQ